MSTLPAAPAAARAAPALLRLWLAAAGLLASPAAAAGRACEAAPSCAPSEDAAVIRVWVPLVGRVQRACDPDTQWSSECVFECSGADYETSYNAASFQGTERGWLAGAAGALRVTEDGGVSWRRQTTGVTDDLLGVHFVSPTKGWLVGVGSVIGQTETGGDAWTWRTDLSDGPTGALHAVHFHDENLGLMVGTNGRIYRTTDGGSSWKLRTWETGKRHFAVHFCAGGEAGIVTGSDGRILWSTTAGHSWVLRDSTVTSDLRSAHCINSTHAWVAGYEGALLRTTDAGVTWSAPSDGSVVSTMFFLGVSFAGDRVGWAVGQSKLPPPASSPGLLLATQDGGITWTEDRRTGLLNQRLNAVASAHLPVPPCPTTTTNEADANTAVVHTTTTTRNVAANEVKDSEYEMLAMVEANSSDRVSVNNAAATVTAQTIRAGDTEQGGALRVTGEKDDDHAVSVPSKVLQHLGATEAVVVLTEFSPGRADWDTDASAQDAMEGREGVQAVAGAPLSVNLGINGAFAAVKDLQTPITVQLLAKHVEGYDCAFWNETTKKWSSDGVRRVLDPSGRLLCETTHLTVFAAVLSEVLQGMMDGFLCTSVEVLSDHGLEATGHGLACQGNRCLLIRPYFWIFFFFLCVQAGLLYRAMQLQKTWKVAGMWHPSCFLVDIPAFKAPELSYLEQAFNIFADVTIFVGDVRANASVWAAAMAVRGSASRKLGISTDDLRVLLEWAQKTVEHHAKEERKIARKMQQKGLQPNHAQAKLAAVQRNAKLLAFVPTIYSCLEEEAKEYCQAVERRSGRDILAYSLQIAISSNPWVKMGYFCIEQPAPEQLLLLTIHIVLALTASAIFFRGSAADHLADARCRTPVQIGAMIGDAIAISLGTVFIAKLPKIILSFLCTRGFVYKKALSGKDIDRTLKRWSAQSALSIVCMCCLTVIGVLYCVSLLANVTFWDGFKWFINFLSTTFTMAAMPVAVALVVAAIGAWTARDFVLHNKKLDLRQKLMLKDEEEQSDEELASELSSQAAGEEEDGPALPALFVNAPGQLSQAFKSIERAKQLQAQRKQVVVAPVRDSRVTGAKAKAKAKAAFLPAQGVEVAPDLRVAAAAAGVGSPLPPPPGAAAAASPWQKAAPLPGQLGK